MPKARKITRRGLPSPPAAPVPATTAERLLGDVRILIEAAREHTAQVVSSGLVGPYWHIGKRIREDVLLERRADYCEAIVSMLSKQLIAAYGLGYSKPNLSRMMWLAEAFPDPEIISTLSKQLSWSRFLEILPLKDPLKRDFTPNCAEGQCGTRGAEKSERQRSTTGITRSRSANEDRPERPARFDT